MTSIALDALPKKDRDLVLAARAAADRCYAPYSGFAVGAAARDVEGRIYAGANLENAAYGPGAHAEVSALAAANAAGAFERIEAIAIVGFKFFPSRAASEPVSPCGNCRQLLFEAAEVSGIDIEVLSCSGDLARIERMRISALLPKAFGPKSLAVRNPPRP